MTKNISRVIGAGSIDAGHAIRIDLEFSDNSKDSLRCDEHLIPTLAQAVIQGGARAEAARKAGPGRAVVLSNAYRARDCKAGETPDGKFVMLGFATQQGPPVEIAMPPEVAQKAIQLLTVALAGLGRDAPFRQN